MTDAVITEYAGTQGARINRYYQYTRNGIRVLDGKRVLKRLYVFDPSANIMSERDIQKNEKVLRRFVFDNYGMIEETFSFGHSPRKFRYEQGGRQIVMREGGDYGAVGKTFTFEAEGIAETAYGRNGEIERVFVFSPNDDAIIERRSGWFGEVERTLAVEGIRASVFREPEAFLQFLMFTETSQTDRDEYVSEQVAKIRGEAQAAAGRSKYAYTGVRHTSTDSERPADPVPVRPGSNSRAVPATMSRTRQRDTGDASIEFISDGDTLPEENFRSGQHQIKRSQDISFEERSQGSRPDPKKLSKGKSAEISYEERRQGRSS